MTDGLADCNTLRESASGQCGPQPSAIGGGGSKCLEHIQARPAYHLTCADLHIAWQAACNR